MYETEKQLMRTEMSKIVDMGLTTSNIERAYKLVDMIKDLAEAEYYEKQLSMMGIGSDTPKRHEHDPYVQYVASKKDYRYDKSEGCKQRLLDTLDEYMDSFAERMEMMLNDAECKEERDTIRRYLSKINELR